MGSYTNLKRSYVFSGVHIRYMLSPVRLPSVVCNVRAPYSGGSNFRQYFYGIRYRGHPLTPAENFHVRCCRKTIIRPTSVSESTFNTLRATMARQSTRQFTQRDTHNQNVCIVTMRAGDGYWLSKHSERKRLIVRRSHRITAGLWGN